MTEFVSSVSSLNALIQNIQNNQIQLNKVGQQVSTGFVSPDLADIQNRSELLNLGESKSQADYYVNAINVSLTKANVLDSVLSRINNDITTLNSAIQQFGPSAVTPKNSAINQQVQQAAADITAALNTSQGGVYLLAGSRYNQAPVSQNGLLQGGTGAAINNIITVSGGTAPASISTVGTDAGGAGPPAGYTYPVTSGVGQVADYDSSFVAYGTAGNSADSKNLAFVQQSVVVENQRSITYGITANNQIFQDLSNALRAIQIGSQTPPPAGVTTAQQAGWLQLASTTLTSLQTQISTTQSLLGLQRKDLQDTATRHNTDSGNLQISISQIQSVDQAKSSTDLISIQSQFQASLTVTKTILGLSLTNFLTH